MKTGLFLFATASLVLLPKLAGAREQITLYPGYVTRVRCEGRLLVSAVGNDTLIRLEALPRELGCGVLLKPMSPGKKTNLILETTTGSIQRVLQISGAGQTPARLEYRLKGDRE